jgi:steroid delta-isomerase-like uncharacterized protein
VYSTNNYVVPLIFILSLPLKFLATTIQKKEKKMDSTTLQTEKRGTIEQNKKLLKNAVEEIWNKGNFDLLGDLITDDFVIHFPRPGEELRGPKNVKQFYSDMRQAFPDIHFTIKEQVAEGNKVVTHWSASGTHKGEFKGIPATGNKVNFTAMDIDKIENGKVVECWTNVDELGLMQQLGVIPAQ